MGDKYHYISTGKLTITNSFPEFEHFIVIPETRGQYTGLTNKNGKKIFEGDIVSLKRFCDNYVGKIVFNSNTAGFEFWWNSTVGAYGEKAAHTTNLSKSDAIEVIGNIHDNPEMLGGGK